MPVEDQGASNGPHVSAHAGGRVMFKWAVAGLALVLSIIFVVRSLTATWHPPKSPSAPGVSTPQPQALKAPEPAPTAGLDAALAQAQHMEAERKALNRRRLREYEQLGKDALADLTAADEQIDAWTRTVEGFLTDERGKLLTGDEQLVQDFRAIYAADRPSKTRVEAIRSGVAELLKPINDAIASNDGSYAPGVSLSDQIQKDRLAAQGIVTAYRNAQADLDALLQRAESPGPLTLREALASVEAQKAQRQAEARTRLDEQEARRNEALRPFMGQWVSHRRPYAFRITDFHPKTVLSDRKDDPVGVRAFTITSIDGRTFVGRELLTNGKSSDLTGQLIDDNLLYLRTTSGYGPYHRADGDPAAAHARVAEEHVDRMRAFFGDPDAIRAYLPTMVVSAVDDETHGWIASQLGKYYESENQFLPLFARNIARSDPAKYGKASLDFDDWVEGWKFTPAGKELLAKYDAMLADTRFQATPYDAFRFSLESKSIREREYRPVEWLNDRIGKLKAKGDTLTKAEKQKLYRLEGWRSAVTRVKFKPPPDPIRP